MIAANFLQLNRSMICRMLRCGSPSLVKEGVRRWSIYSMQSNHPSIPSLSKEGKSLILLFVVLLIASFAFAQTNERVYEELGFRFVTPGARAIAMGKTFVGVADDATAAYTNPAGLSNLLEPEFSFEFMSTDIKHVRFVPSESGETQTFGNRVYAPSFFSYALPYRNFTFSLFRNVVQDYSEQFQLPSRLINSIHHFENGAFGNISIDAENYGLGVSFLANRYFSIGVSAVGSHADVHTQGRTGRLTQPVNGTDTNDSGWARGAIVGVLFKPNPKLSVGAVYNSGATFHMKTTLRGVFAFQPGLRIDLTGQQRRIDYVIPEHYSFGVSSKLQENLTLAFDLSRINYSKQITDNFLILDFINLLNRRNYFINDVTELHVGAEYRIYRRGTTIAVRGGLFTDQDHQLHFRSLEGTDPVAAAVESFRFNSLKQPDVVGATFGAGVALNNKIQIDTAFGFSRNGNDAVISWVMKL
jgi:long-chain fatty acid transport protein